MVAGTFVSRHRRRARGKNRMKHCALAALVAVFIVVVTAPAQVIQVAPATEVARETDPKRFSEPHLAIHPTNSKHLLAAVFISWVQGALEEIRAHERCAAFVSLDGGATWNRHEFSLESCFDPQVAILPNGEAVFIALAEILNIQPRHSIWLIAFHSSDGGLTWDEEPTILGRGHDHPALAVDTSSAKRKGWIYVSTHHEWRDGNGQPASGVFIARSRDGGKSFDTPTIVRPNNLHSFAEMPVVLSDGTVIASFVDDTNDQPKFERRRAWIIRSTDGASSFSLPIFVNDVCGPPPNFQLSALVADTSDGQFRDRLYFACRQNGGGSIIVTSSANRGETWNRPGVGVGTPAPDPNARRVLTMGVNRNGVVGVFIAERSFKIGEACLEFSFSASFDGGTTFVAPQKVSSSSCGKTTADEIAARMFPTYGDYFGVVGTNNAKFRLMWVEMRDGHSVLLTTLGTVAP